MRYFWQQVFLLCTIVLTRSSASLLPAINAIEGETTENQRATSRRRGLRKDKKDKKIKGGGRKKRRTTSPTISTVPTSTPLPSQSPTMSTVPTLTPLPTQSPNTTKSPTNKGKRKGKKKKNIFAASSSNLDREGQ